MIQKVSSLNYIATDRIPINKIGLGMLILCVLAGVLFIRVFPLVIVLSILTIFTVIALANPRTGLIIAIIALPISQDWIRFSLFNFNITFSYMFASILFFAWITRRIIGRERSRIVRLPVYPPMITFLFANVISDMLSSSPLIGIKNIIKIIYYLILFMLIANIIVTEQDLNRVVRSWFLSNVFFSLIALAIYLSPFEIPSSWTIDFSSNIISSTISEVKADKSMDSGNLKVNRLALGFGSGWVDSAIFPMVGILFIACLWLQRAAIVRIKKKYVVIMLLLIIVLLVSYTRGGWLATLAGLGMLLMFERRNPRLIIIVLGLFLIVIIAPSVIVGRFHGIFGGEESARVGRLVLWSETWGYIQQNPFFGIGPAMISSYLNPFAVALGWARIDSVVLPHNVWLTFWAETGTIGFFILIWLLFTTIQPAIVTLKKTLKTPQALYSETLLVLTIAAVVFGIFTNRLADWFWVLLALLSVSNRLAILKSANSPIGLSNKYQQNFK